jgi:hypothetical protein
MKTYGRVDVYILTSALVGGEWSVSRFGRFNLGERVPSTHWKLGGPQIRSGRRGEKKILDSTETRTPTPLVHPVAGRYTDCAIPTLNMATIQNCIHAQVGMRQGYHSIPEIYLLNQVSSETMHFLTLPPKAEWMCSLTNNQKFNFSRVILY